MVLVTVRGPAIWWCTAGAAVLACAAFAAVLWLDPGGLTILQAGPYRLRDPVGDMGPAAPLASIIANALTVVIPVPGTAVAMLNGALFGPWSGACLNWIGGMAGAGLCFWLGRTLAAPRLRPLLARRARSRDEDGARAPVRAWARRLEHPTGGAVALARLVGAPFGLVSYLAATTAIGWWPFLWGTAAGSLPRAVAYAALGSTLRLPIWVGVVSAPALALAWAGLRMLPRALQRTT